MLPLELPNVFVEEEGSQSVWCRESQRETFRNEVEEGRGVRGKPSRVLEGHSICMSLV